MKESAYLAVVIGNTTLRWCLVQAGEPTAAGAVPVDESVPDDLRTAGSGLPTYVASVNPPRVERLNEELPGPLILIGRDVPVPLRNDTREPEQVGVDRLLAALGAWEAHGPAVVVDAGTAITVDLVTEGPAFRGGAIMPGPRLWARALNRETALLPDVHPTDTPNPLGGDTADAIASGIYWGTLGAVRMLIDKLRQERPDATVCVTGGGARFFAPALGIDVTMDPDLLVAGIMATVAVAESRG